MHRRFTAICNVLTEQDLRLRISEGSKKRGGNICRMVNVRASVVRCTGMLFVPIIVLDIRKKTEKRIL